ncbi:Oligosaccharide translocation RFT1 [Hyphodiscus hymeniophilus]|uniref:Man(5)GlcNAc(2)-PP-dolichol translocation protein RFT1 n=1 Tax=Hyphodiscus hymeniophilus TaxID=353542 RepID=A0A9P6VQN7_9HELO|nr:Oligosaccharide translocation RFT1 [Hyphodiscus hymeniophilus]
MKSEKTSPPEGEETPPNKDALLSTSTAGGVLLIGIQSGSRAVTFVGNQILLRYLSPEILGISTQLEVYSISVLFFARESLRVAIQRQSDTNDETAYRGEKKKIPHSHVDGRTAAGRTQALVNLAYLSINLGIIFAIFFAVLYHNGIRSSDPTILQTPYFGNTLKIYGVAAVLELLSEPCFVIVAQKSQIRIRGAAEVVGTLLRCLVTCGSAIWASRNGKDLGILPFAMGQTVYAVSLLAIYYGSVWRTASAGHFSLFLKSIYSNDPEAYFLSYFSRPLLALIGSLFTQGILKHFLTQGDTFIISTLASAHAQGVYALAANYGGLVARLVLQPIEESSRTYFGQLLFSTSGAPSPSAIKEACSHLQILLRTYVLLSVGILAVGPTLAPLLLKIVAGPQWTTAGAGDVLATYCYYIPLLAINGLSEAFVSSVATEKEVNRQSLWMLAFSAGFAGAAFFFLGFLNMGAEGLVWANVLNMVFRIAWSTRFASFYMKRNGSRLVYESLRPRGLTLAVAVGTWAALRRLQTMHFCGDTFEDFLKTGVVAIVFVGIVAYSEYEFLLERYNTFRVQLGRWWADKAAKRNRTL